MVKLFVQFAGLSACTILFSCKKDSAPGDPLLFDSVPVAKTVVPLIAEASGIADSRANTNFLWVQEDGGGGNQLYLLGYDGKVAKTIFLQGVTNRDWEDMALVGNDLYIADIGDNENVYTEYFIHKFTEPPAATDTVKNIETISFRYPDAPHDAEAFLVDPDTKDIFILTKQDQPSRIYKIAYPYSTASVNTATWVGALPHVGVVSAALSSDGKEVVLKTYTQLFYYPRLSGESIPQTLSKTHTLLPYKVEPQGEAVTFSNNHAGYFTLSEKGFSNQVALFFYRRK